MTVIVIGLGSMGKRRIRLMKAMKLPIDIVGVDSRQERCEETRSQLLIDCCTSIEAKHSNISISMDNLNKVGVLVIYLQIS